MHSLSLLPLVQFSSASTDWLKEVQTPKTRRGDTFWTVQLYSVGFFTPHTGVMCAHLGTCCSIFYSCFVSFLRRKKRNSLYKKNPALSGQCCATSILLFQTERPQLPGVTAPFPDWFRLAALFLSHHTSFKSTRDFGNAKRKNLSLRKRKNKIRSAYVCPWQNVF